MANQVLGSHLFGLSAALAGIGLAAQQLQFMPSTGRSASLLPLDVPVNGLAVGDLDGDGRADVVTTEGQSLHLFFAMPAGFDGATSFPVSTQSLSQRPVLFDLEGDGDLDIAIVPDSGDAEFTVLRRELGGFLRVSTPWWSTIVHAVAGGDVDGDGDIDFVVSIPTGAPVAQGLVLLRQSFSVFQADAPAMPANLPTGTRPVLTDLDGDGDLDVVAVDAPGGMRWLRNDNGFFVDASASLPVTAGNHRQGIAGDLDGDGHGDVAVLTGGGAIDVLWGGASVQFAAGFVPGAFDRVDVIDVDADGDLDLVCYLPNGFRLLRNDGGRQFTPGPTVVDVHPRVGAGVGDLDGDGRGDVLFCTGGAEPRVRCAFGPGLLEDVASSLGMRFGPEVEVIPPLAGDFDGDGRIDLLRLTRTSFDAQLAQGADRYRSVTSSIAIRSVGVAAVCDLDGDGDLDLVGVGASAGGTTSDLAMWGNDGSAHFTLLTSRSLGGPGVYDGLVLGDVDGDGDTDVLVATGTAVQLTRAQPGGAWSPLAIVSTTTQPAPNLPIELVDVDGDGDLDLATGEIAGAGTLLLLNDGTGVFTPSPTLLPVGSFGFSVIAAGDVDGDGDADLVTNGPFGDMKLLIGLGNGTFVDATSAHLPPGALAPPGVTPMIEDFDGDADLDILFPSSFVPRFFVNDGTGHFTDRTSSRWRQPSQPGNLFWSRAIDADGDGDLDVAFFGNARDIWWNHLRQLVSRAVPHLGGNFEFDVYSGPSFGAPGASIVAASLALAPTPFAVPGVDGRLELDLNGAVLVGLTPSTSIGVSRLFVPVPTTARAVGVELFFQHAALPIAGRPAFGAAIVERILP